MTNNTDRELLEFGDEVAFTLEGIPGSGIVIGEPPYSKNVSHVIVASSDALGMPINSEHCKVVNKNAALAAELFRNYKDKFPYFIKEAEIGRKM